jgi:hypothetical protein
MTRVAVGQENTTSVSREIPQSDLNALQQPKLLDQSLKSNQPITSDVSIVPTGEDGGLLIVATHKRRESEMPTASALLTYSGKYGVFSSLESNSSESGLKARDAVMEVLELGIKQFRLLGVEHISLKECPPSLNSLVQAMGFRECAESGSMVFGKGKS